MFVFRGFAMPVFGYNFQNLINVFFLLLPTFHFPLVFNYLDVQTLEVMIIDFQRKKWNKINESSRTFLPALRHVKCFGSLTMFDQATSHREGRTTSRAIRNRAR